MVTYSYMLRSDEVKNSISVGYGDNVEVTYGWNILIKKNTYVNVKPPLTVRLRASLRKSYIRTHELIMAVDITNHTHGLSLSSAF